MGAQDGSDKLSHAASMLQLPAATGVRAVLTSSAGFMAPEAEREKGAVTAATQDRDLECPFFSGGPALAPAPASRAGGPSPTSRECAREVAAEE